jgi:hypothetical protein
MHFRCSLKPAAIPSGTDPDFLEQFFGRNPPTYRRYVHSAEVLALQMITERLSPLGVKFLHSGFYGGTAADSNLLIGSESNNELSIAILKFVANRIGRVEPAQGATSISRSETASMRAATPRRSMGYDG